jgi:hypothetical protein
VFIRRAKPARKDEYFVDNDRLRRELVEYVRQVKEAKANGQVEPRLNDYIGDAIYKTANKLATSRSFINYSYKEEMIGDAIENCVAGVKNYDESVSKYAFAYLTQICYYAFINRIAVEKKEQYVKYKQGDVFRTWALSQEGGAFDPDLGITDDVTSRIISDFEDKLAKKKSENRAKREAKGLEVFADKKETSDDGAAAAADPARLDS